MKISWISILLVTFIILETRSWQVLNLYVDSTIGSDSNPCTNKTLPCQTLKHVFDVASGADYHFQVRIYLLSDLVVDEETIFDSPLNRTTMNILTLSSYGDELTKLTFENTGRIEITRDYSRINGFEIIDVRDRVTPLSSIIEVHSLSNSLLSIKNSQIIADIVTSSNFTILGSIPKILNIEYFDTCTFSGNEKGYEIFERVFLYFKGGCIFHDFPLNFTQPSNDEKFTIIFEVTVGGVGSEFLFTKKFPSEVKTPFTFSNGTFFFQHSKFAGFKSTSSSSSLFTINEHATVSFLGNNNDEEVKTSVSSSSIENHEVGTLFDISERSSVELYYYTVQNNQVKNSMFRVTDRQSVVKLTNSKFSNNDGPLFYDFSNSLGIQDEGSEYDEADNFQTFFSCSTTSTEGRQLSVIMDFDGISISPYINNVECDGNCVVVGYSSCDKFYDKFKNSKKNDHGDGEYKYLEWLIPAIAVGVLLICCVGMTCICCLLMVLSGGIWMIIKSKGSGELGIKEYIRVDGNGDDIW